MATPAIPNNFNLQTGNVQNYLSWSIASGATSYIVQRSIDGVTYANYAAPTSTDYLDTVVTAGTQYYYQVASVNSTGQSGFTAPQSIVPTAGGEMSLGQIRLAAQQRADRVNSNFLTLPEWNSNINQSMYELYDLLVTVYEDLYVAPFAYATLTAASSYPLPDGTNTYNDISGTPFIPKPFYKLLGVDLGLNTANNAWVTLDKYNLIDRNAYVYPNSSSALYGVFNMRYRVLGKNLEFIPVPSSANQIFRLLYIPRLTQLLKDTDISDVSISGWIEYVIVDAAIKALQKEESDVTVLMGQKMMLKARIEESAANRDAGRPDTISDTRGASSGYWGNGWNGPVGGW